eukprot:CAMPEP_0178427204 /NCGR_PEP_ID=MMETSP0689_2-20121128/29622_1 /TAXON_ID=160604 /ORGANISM="Amphidinium massartii, Strain CS-259" /LENGTH=279 /DNA_ID=CAMNT_0020048899 /DNA_START=36 /DNA_END=872 /DNA_ORIENTATION=+
MAELKATLKQALSRNKAGQKKDMWEMRAVEEKPEENFAWSLKNADGELLAVVPKLPETAKVTANDANKYEQERLKRANEKEDAQLGKYCDGKNNAWRPDSFFEESLGEKDVPWPMRPTDFYNNPNLVSRVVQAYEESRRLERKKKKEAEKQSKKKDKKEKKKKKKDKKKSKKDKKEKKEKKIKKEAKRLKEEAAAAPTAGSKRPKSASGPIEVVDDDELPKEAAQAAKKAKHPTNATGASRSETGAGGRQSPDDDGEADSEDADVVGSSSSSDSDAADF